MADAMMKGSTSTWPPKLDWWGFVDITAPALNFLLCNKSTNKLVQLIYLASVTRPGKQALPPNQLAQVVDVMLAGVSKPRPFGQRLLPSQWLYWVTTEHFSPPVCSMVFFGKLPAVSTVLLQQGLIVPLNHLVHAASQLLEPATHWQVLILFLCS